MKPSNTFHVNMHFDIPHRKYAWSYLTARWPVFCDWKTLAILLNMGHLQWQMQWQIQQDTAVPSKGLVVFCMCRKIPNTTHKNIWLGRASPATHILDFSCFLWDLYDQMELLQFNSYIWGKLLDYLYFQ